MYVQAAGTGSRFSPTTSATAKRVADDTPRDSYGPVPTVRTLACNTGMHGALREPRRLALLHQGSDPDVVASLVRDNLQFAVTDDAHVFTERVRNAARHAGVEPRALEVTCRRVLRDVEEITVERTLHGPVSRALVRGLYLRNRELERVANDAKTHRDDATQARSYLRENDVLIHALESGAMHGDLYGVDPELTRRVIDSDAVGIPSTAYPFAGITARTFAQVAVLRDVREAQVLDGKVATLLASAARATRAVSPDALELVGRDLTRPGDARCH